MQLLRRPKDAIAMVIRNGRCTLFYWLTTTCFIVVRSENNTRNITLSLQSRSDSDVRNKETAES